MLSIRFFTSSFPIVWEEMLYAVDQLFLRELPGGLNVLSFTFFMFQLWLAHLTALIVGVSMISPFNMNLCQIRVCENNRWGLSSCYSVKLFSGRCIQAVKRRNFPELWLQRSVWHHYELLVALSTDQTVWLFDLLDRDMKFHQSPRARFFFQWTP